jgi:hypothetical protein
VNTTSAAVMLTEVADWPGRLDILDADEQASRDGWQVSLAIQHNIATLFILSPDLPGGQPVSITVSIPRGIRDLPVACASFPVHDLDTLFDDGASLYDHAWECIPRLYRTARTLSALSTDQRLAADRRERQRLLSWAALPDEDARTWQKHGCHSGVLALGLTRLGVSPAQAEPYLPRIRGGERWSAREIAAFLKYDVSGDQAKEWETVRTAWGTAVSTFVSHGYTVADTLDLRAAIRFEQQREIGPNTDRTDPQRWIRPTIPPNAAAAVRAGLTADEARQPGVSLDTLRMLAALRQGDSLTG